HPRYEMGQSKRVLKELGATMLALSLQAKSAGIGLNIDAEEASRLDLSLSLIETLLANPDLAGWDGLGVVVQTYGKRAHHVLDWLYALVRQLDRRISVRLVKGAYWDTEIKQAQVNGLDGFPVYTNKDATDVAYLYCAQKLLGMTDRIYPQFATHNAHSVAMILELAKGRTGYEFQRLHGMGQALHDLALERADVPCRIYAPVGAYRDLLAYLVRRLLENGANSSFVNQIIDESVPAQMVAADPFERIKSRSANPAIVAPAAIFGKERVNSRGFDLSEPEHIRAIDAARASHRSSTWHAAPRLAAGQIADRAEGLAVPVANPANAGDIVGHVVLATSRDVDTAIAAARPWNVAVAKRMACLTRASALIEADYGEVIALLTREAGKTPADAISELREAVDFLRYYAARADELENAERGVISCVSPWNFPLAIFTGQIAAALAAGNAVLAKPAEATCLIADLAVRCLHEAGVPRAALQLLPGPGSVVGARMTSDPQVDGVCFTGSTATAISINRGMAEHMAPGAPLVAETGGLNAMMVDSTALPEQAIGDILTSAFQSAGQRCSALRMLYLQADIAQSFLELLTGAMDELVVGDPWDLSTDVGPVIDGSARDGITAYIAATRAQGRLIKQLAAPSGGHFIGPTVIRLSGIGELEREVFGPVLHVATFEAAEIDVVVEAINATGFGLTFGMHSRIDDRVEQVTSRIAAGNIYVNRDQIGAVVGSQPFGGEGMSGTGPKAGGPSYVRRFTRAESETSPVRNGATADVTAVQALLDRADNVRPRKLRVRSLPGPTGESNRLSTWGRGVILCLGPSAEAAARQMRVAESNGCTAVAVAPGASGDHALDGLLAREDLATLQHVSGVALWSEGADQRRARTALASRDGPIVPLWTDLDLADRCVMERHLCVDTTASGGNASLLAAAGAQA
ncbi:MAG: bifunctional proline dehydrogenase/L-glutamate gamma-semialdehyde dehydrogenase PutA, partial [Alphaproteobacteria bacterium]